MHANASIQAFRNAVAAASAAQVGRDAIDPGVSMDDHEGPSHPLDDTAMRGRNHYTLLWMHAECGSLARSRDDGNPMCEICNQPMLRRVWMMRPELWLEVGSRYCALVTLTIPCQDLEDGLKAHQFIKPSGYQDIFSDVIDGHKLKLNGCAELLANGLHPLLLHGDGIQVSDKQIHGTFCAILSLFHLDRLCVGVFVLQAVDLSVEPETRLRPGVCVPLVLVEGPNEPPLRGIMAALTLCKQRPYVPLQFLTCLRLPTVLQVLLDKAIAFLAIFAADQPAG
jgi:hypothetical protein